MNFFFSKRFFSCMAALTLLFCFASCDEEESEIGVALQDQATLYDGIIDTAYCRAVTVLDDSLVTSGQSNTLLGNYSDPVFGTAEAIFYSQITTFSNGGVEFDENCVIDSVVLSLYIASLFPDDEATSHNLHFEVRQLAENNLTDTTHYSTEELEVSNVEYFNGVVNLATSDSMVVKMRLNDNFLPLLVNKKYDNSAAFVEASKGLRIRLLNDGTPIMATVNLASAATTLTTYYRYIVGEDTISRTFDFSVGHSSPRYSQFKNNYNGVLSTFNTNRTDSVDGSRYLYLSPMGGTNVKLDFNAFVTQFSRQHPFAVIHYAELVLPLADIAPDAKPSLIAALKYDSEGVTSSIPDMYDQFTYSGFDGTYSEERGGYRMRITQHLQKLMKQGVDYGTLLLLSGRRSAAEHTVVNGCDATATAGSPVLIRFVYTE
jgi:hypothetical protein